MKAKKYGLSRLASDWGMSIDDLLQECIIDSVNPGICPDCGYSTEVEPDQSQGWCEICEKGTVKSALVLAGLI